MDGTDFAISKIKRRRNFQQVRTGLLRIENTGSVLEGRGKNGHL